MSENRSKLQQKLHDLLLNNMIEQLEGGEVSPALLTAALKYLAQEKIEAPKSEARSKLADLVSKYEDSLGDEAYDDQIPV